MGFVQFGYNVSEFGDRIGFMITLILTAVAFKFLISSSMPKVPYQERPVVRILFVDLHSAHHIKLILMTL